LSDIVGDQKLITFSSDNSVHDALKTLHHYNISGAPVVDEDGDPFGQIDMLDLVSYCYLKLDPDKKEIDTERVEQFLNKAPLLGLMDISNRNAWHSIPATKSLSKALNVLGHPNMHRIYLIGKEGKPNGVLTQSRAIDFFLENKDKLQERMRMPIRELFPESNQGVMIHWNDSLISAFKKIYQTKVSGLAVVDDEGVLKGSISASDLKYCKWSNITGLCRNLKQPIQTFLSWREKSAELFGDRPPHLEPVVVMLDDPIEKAMEMCRKHKVHRIYVVDKDRKLLKVISLGDLISQFRF